MELQARMRACERLQQLLCVMGGIACAPVQPKRRGSRNSSALHFDAVKPMTVMSPETDRLKRRAVKSSFREATVAMMEP